jgi:hypothetical protein
MNGNSPLALFTQIASASRGRTTAATAPWSGDTGLVRDLSRKNGAQKTLRRATRFGFICVCADRRRREGPFARSRLQQLRWRRRRL